MTKSKPRQKLTLKQAKFAKEYIKSGNGTQAAIKAGYSKNSAQEIASENLSKPIVRNEIQSAAEKLGINAEYVFANLKKAAEVTGKTYQKVMGEGEKAETYETLVDANAFLKTNELFGKHLKLFTDQVDVNAKVEIKTDEEQEKLIAKRAALLLMKNNLED